MEQAAALSILDASSGTYTDLRARAKMLIGDAVDMQLVQVEYDTKASGNAFDCKVITAWFEHDDLSGLGCY